MHHTGRACCIFVPSLRNEPLVARGKGSTTQSQNRKENEAWWLRLPHQTISHILIWWLEGQSWLADFPEQISQAVAAVSFHHAWPSKGQNSGSLLFLPGSGQTCIHVVFVLKKKHWQQRILVPKTFFPLLLDGKFPSVPHQLMHWKLLSLKRVEEQNCVLMLTNCTNTRLKKLRVDAVMMVWLLEGCKFSCRGRTRANFKKVISNSLETQKSLAETSLKGD